MKYYAVERNTDHLFHYGIKGMHWGVRKAIESGNQKKLTKQYRKAQKKLNKLNKRADIDFQKEIAKKHNKRAKVALGVGLVGIGGFGGVHLLSKKSKEILGTSVKPRSRIKNVVGEGKDFKKVGEGLNKNVSTSKAIANRVGNNELFYGAHSGLNEEARRTINSNSSKLIKNNNMKTIYDISKALSITGLGTAAYQKSRAIIAKRRTTDKAHAKAVAKRDAFKREMNAAFKGTKYDPKSKKSR